MTINELYMYGKKNLADPNESIILCEELYNLSRQDIIINPNTEIENPEIFLDAVARRKKCEPLQYILNYWDFDDIRLKVKNGVLIPREDTMVLVGCAVDFIKDKPLYGLDLCSGTGAVALSLAKNCKNAKIEALELYPIPLECLKDNVENFGDNRVTYKKADIFNAYKDYEALDFIVANPPYIESREISTLQFEVQNEPHTALDGGADGLDFYKVICQTWSKCLKSGGFLAVEIGENQGENVKNLFLQNGFTDVKIVLDFNSLPRVIYGEK